MVCIFLRAYHPTNGPNVRSNTTFLPDIRLERRGSPMSSRQFKVRRHIRHPEQLLHNCQRHLLRQIAPFSSNNTPFFLSYTVPCQLRSWRVCGTPNTYRSTSNSNYCTCQCIAKCCCMSNRRWHTRSANNKIV